MDIKTHVDELVSGYSRAKTERVEGNYFKPYEVIKTVEYYTDSKYLNGQQDELGRDKPFYNIINYRLNTAYKATPFATKDIQLVPDGGENTMKVSLLSKELHDWFKEVNYDATIDKMRYVRPKYGELIVKKVEKEGTLDIQVVDMRNIVVDPTELYNTFIEIHYVSPSKLSKMKGKWNHVEEILEEKNLKTTTVTNAIGSESEVSIDQYEIHEVYGEFPESMIKEDGDETEYKLYRVYMCGEYILDAREVDDFPYKNLSWEELGGRSLGRGVVEDGFEAQVWSNDAVLKERDMMEHAAKPVFVTDDDEVEDNILMDYDSGQIVHVNDGRKLTLLNNVPSSLPQIQSILNKWDAQYERTSSSFESVTGENMPSRTPFRTVAMLQQAGSSSFEEKNKAFGIFQKELIYDWVLPYLIKKLKKEHILVAEFTKEEMEDYLDDFATYEVNQFLRDQTLKMNNISKEDMGVLMEAAKSQAKSKRAMRIPEGYYDNIKTKVDILTTGENMDKQAMFESLNNLMMTVAQNPQIMTDPALSKLFGKIIDLSGVGVTLPELTNQLNVEQNQPTLPGQSNPGGAQGVQPGMPGQENLGGGQ